MPSLAQRIPKGEALRFLIAGAGNTLFGIADTFLFTWVCVHARPAHAAIATSVALLLATVVNITVSFLSYKWFVFRTEGNYLREYARSWMVYVPSLLVSMVAVAPLAAVLAHWLPHPKLAPYAAQACIVAVAVVPQFLGHKNLTFRKKTAVLPGRASVEQ